MQQGGNMQATFELFCRALNEVNVITNTNKFVPGTNPIYMYMQAYIRKTRYKYEYYY